MPKIHKEKTPVPLRPVISQCGSLSFFISKYIDYILQQFTPIISSHILNSTDLLNNIDTIHNISDNTFLFTSDATSMYTNINTPEGINAIQKFLIELAPHTEEHLTELIIKLLQIVMNNNIFQFGSSWWLQKMGTAMGTPCACIYATMFFAYFEQTILLRKYQNNLRLFKRQIDDIIGVWVITEPDNTSWTAFKDDLNNCTSLEWTTTDLSTTVNFLDLTLTIDRNSKSITYSTFQKPMNLFLYIPAHSSHTPGVTKGLIFGLLQTYHRQNPNPSDFNNITQLLFQRLIDRGHTAHIIQPIFDSIIDKLKNKTYTPQQAHTTSHHNNNLAQTTDFSQQIFFHLKYHPNELPRHLIQQIYNDTCNWTDNLGESFKSIKNEETNATMIINKLTIAYSRPNNLRDKLVPSKLTEFTDCNVSQFIPQHLKSHDSN